MKMDNFNPHDYWQNRGITHGATSIPKKVKGEVETLATWIAVHSVKSILDIGSGWGRIYFYLKEQRLADNYTMVDFVDSMREGCRRRTGILPDKWDGETLPYANDSFDLVLSVEVLLHVPPTDIGQMLAEHVRVSRRWLYIMTLGTCYAPLSEHCFWHDYLKLFSEAKLCVVDARFWQQGLHVHWILEKSK